MAQIGPRKDRVYGRMCGKISIIIPAYNVEKELAGTLDSVLAQTYGNIEVIVVNDGSVDATAAVIGGYAAGDSRVKAIHKEHGGVTSARLRGVAEAGGDWIGFVDGDDLIEPRMYERLLENAQAYGADISHCGYRMILPGGRVRDYYNTGRLVLQDQSAGVKDLLEGRFVEPGLVNKLFRRALFAGMENRMDMTIRNNEDLLMNYYLFRRAKRSVFEDICPYHYILREGSAAHGRLTAHRLEDPLKVKRILFRETQADPVHHRIVGSQLVRQLAAMATRSSAGDAGLIGPVKKRAGAELRSMLPQLLGADYCTAKFKLIAVWACLWPASYGFFHRVYEKITGIDKMYE